MCYLHCIRAEGYLERVSFPISSALVDALAQNSFTNALSLAERLIVPLGCAKILPMSWHWHPFYTLVGTRHTLGQMPD